MQLLANTLRKQSQMIAGVIAQINGAEVTDLPELDMIAQDQMAMFCEVNPQHPECSAFNGGMTTNVLEGGGLNLSGVNGTNSLNAVTDGTPDVIEPEFTGNSDGPDTKKSPTSRSVASVDKSSGLVDAPAGKAKVSSNGPQGATAGGGGGGAAPSGGGISGGGGPGGANGAIAGGSRGGKKFKLGYRGGSRSLSMRGGRGGKNKKTSSKANPFAKMFKGNGKSQTLNFRNLASKGLIGSKKGNIFDQISVRYKVVNQRNDLLKYETTESSAVDAMEP